MINYMSIGVLLSVLLLAIALFVLMRGLRLPANYVQRKQQRSELRKQYLNAKDEERELVAQQPAGEDRTKSRPKTAKPDNER